MTESIPLDVLSFDEVQEMLISDMEKTAERLSASKVRFILMGQRRIGRMPISTGGTSVDSSTVSILSARIVVGLLFLTSISRSALFITPDSIQMSLLMSITMPARSAMDASMNRRKGNGFQKTRRQG